ncbi:MAG: helix-turn-helix transcriptional regulator [Ruminococcus sp.]|nr:helix-turn-helix transcriptional regulator [Ruminococcus sp.]MDD6446354.1 helix-turn-helix transcriptional regulator [Ruminococcus sp.]MDY2856108.1 helix-turn-helix transcriptional regulator [Oscillospiraceae bacterium]
MKELGLKLKYYRENCELSQQQVANVLNVDRSTYTYYETGKTTPSASTLLKLAKIFNVPCSVFLESINQELELNSLVADSVDNKKSSDTGSYEADEKIYNLSKEEKDMLIAYRVLNKNGQEKAQEYFKKLTGK